MSTKTLRVVLSIVSHGQLQLIDALLSDLDQKIERGFEIVLTINIPEDESILEKYGHLPISIIRNISPKGFGENHNAAFKASSSDLFFVVNPDIRISSISWHHLVSVFDASNVGACAPLILSDSGTLEDSARRFPTVRTLLERVLFNRRTPDFVPSTDTFEVDWAAGMFVAYRSIAFEQIAGFDARYFMYMEDADICRRLNRKGWKTMIEPNVSVVHHAQRASRKNLRHLRWHLGSAFRFLFLTQA